MTTGAPSVSGAGGRPPGAEGLGCLDKRCPFFWVFTCFYCPTRFFLFYLGCFLCLFRGSFFFGELWVRIWAFLFANFKAFRVILFL